jgi:hypothetical protein
MRGIVGGETRGKETDGCPLTLPPPSKCGIMMRKDCQEVARSTLVKGIKLKMAALIWRAAPGYLWWNCTIFGLAYTVANKTIQMFSTCGKMHLHCMR